MEKNENGSTNFLTPIFSCQIMSLLKDGTGRFLCISIIQPTLTFALGLSLSREQFTR